MHNGLVLYSGRGGRRRRSKATDSVYAQAVHRYGDLQSLWHQASNRRAVPGVQQPAIIHI